MLTHFDRGDPMDFDLLPQSAPSISDPRQAILSQSTNDAQQPENFPEEWDLTVTTKSVSRRLSTVLIGY
jgi:hypothetical protein